MYLLFSSYNTQLKNSLKLGYLSCAASGVLQPRCTTLPGDCLRTLCDRMTREWRELGLRKGAELRTGPRKVVGVGQG